MGLVIVFPVHVTAPKQLTDRLMHVVFQGLRLLATSGSVFPLRLLFDPLYLADIHRKEKGELS